MANNVNNGITGVIDIPGALRPRGAADGNLVGGVVAYAGDIYDTTLGENQATVNSQLSGRLSLLDDTVQTGITAAAEYYSDILTAIGDLGSEGAIAAQVAINQANINKAPYVNNNSNADLDIADEQGYVLARFKDGHIQVKNFNSIDILDSVQAILFNIGFDNIPEFDEEENYAVGDVVRHDKYVYVFTASHAAGEWDDEDVERTAIPSDFPIDLENTSSNADLDISDENGYSVARFSDGHIKTKEFDSKTTPSQGITSSSDLDITDEQGDAVVRFANGHIRTKEFDSREVPTEGMTSSSDLDITDEQGNVVVRFANGHIKTKNFDSSKKSGGSGSGGSGSWAFLKIRDYTEVLTMNPDDVVNIVETVSNGKFTAIYDDAGYPSLMYKIPIMSIGMLDSDLGDFVTPHPAFVVNGVAKPYIYISVYMTSNYEGHYVSWWGLKPLGSTSHSALRSTIMSKGAGWHLETIYERSLLSNLARKLNDEQIHCNSYWGCNYHNKAESCEMANGRLPGKTNQSNGAKWINGTQPAIWSHDKTVWGIQDVCGGYHEIVDLIKMIDGQIYLASDNDWNKESAQYSATGVYYDWDNNNMPILSNSMTSSYSGQEGKYITSDYTTLLCSLGYDTLSEALRKKMVLLGLSPRLSSSSSSTKYNYRGKIGVNTDVNSHYIFGGAEEYNNAGLGYYIAAYDTDVYTHNNMGSRICFIK